MDNDNVQPINGAAQEMDAILGADELTALLQNEEERNVAAKLLHPLTAKITAMAEARNASKLQKHLDELMASNKEIMEKELEKLRKSNTPPTPQEIQTLLSQEYAEFTVTLVAGGTKREFILRELNMEAEAKVVKAVQKTVRDRLQELNSVEWEGATVLERIVKITAVVPGVMETLSDCCAVCLDPLNEQQYITGTWVRQNMSLTRMTSILMAQIMVGKYRDFFSQAFRSMPSMIM